MFAFHVEKAKKINQLAELCVLAFKECDAPPLWNVADSKLLDDLDIPQLDSSGPFSITKCYISDELGRKIAIYVRRGEQWMCLANADFQNIIRLVDEIRGEKRIKRQTDCNYVFGLAEAWTEKRLNAFTTEDISEYVTRSFNSDYVETTVRIPFEGILMAPPPIGSAFDIIRLDADNWPPDIFVGLSPNTQSFQFVMKGVKPSIENLALRKAGNIVSCFQLYQNMGEPLKALSWNISGGRTLPNVFVATRDGDSEYSLHNCLMPGNLTFSADIMLTADKMSAMSYLGIGKAFHLFNDPQEDLLGEKLKASIGLFAQGRRSYLLREKLLQSISAAECLLLADANESIGKSVGDRLAFILSRNAEERMAISKNFRDAYKFRSGMTHHGDTNADAAVISTCITNVRRALISTVAVRRQYKDYNTFIRTFDQLFYA
ncbi:hypothetical protein [Methylobacterium brachiatum]